MGNGNLYFKGKILLAYIFYTLNTFSPNSLSIESEFEASVISTTDIYNGITTTKSTATSASTEASTEAITEAITEASTDTTPTTSPATSASTETSPDTTTYKGTVTSTATSTAASNAVSTATINDEATAQPNTENTTKSRIFNKIVFIVGIVSLIIITFILFFLIIFIVIKKMKASADSRRAKKLLEKEEKINKTWLTSFGRSPTMTSIKSAWGSIGCLFKKKQKKDSESPAKANRCCPTEEEWLPEPGKSKGFYPLTINTGMFQNDMFLKSKMSPVPVTKPLIPFEEYNWLQQRHLIQKKRDLEFAQMRERQNALIKSAQEMLNQKIV